MFVSVARFAFTIRSPLAFARHATFSTRLDSLRGRNGLAHFSAPITTGLRSTGLRSIGTALGFTIIRFLSCHRVLAPRQAQASVPTGMGNPWAWIWAGMLLGTGATMVLTLATVVGQAFAGQQEKELGPSARFHRNREGTGPQLPP